METIREDSDEEEAHEENRLEIIDDASADPNSVSLARSFYHG